MASTDGGPNLLKRKAFMLYIALRTLCRFQIDDVSIAADYATRHESFRSRTGFLQLNEAAACGGCDCLGAADHIEFAENTFDVGFNRAFADE